MFSRAIEERVRSIVNRILNLSHGSKTPGDVPLLGDDGAFDSVIALELVLALENEFNIVVIDHEVAPENLRDINSMVRFVETKMGRPETANKA